MVGTTYHENEGTVRRGRLTARYWGRTGRRNDGLRITGKPNGAELIPNPQSLIPIFKENPHAAGAAPRNMKIVIGLKVG